uniref:Uncharacterized protein n=1 Tax=Ditylenchus dipsaci TaxID=166011 RepID=A0A915DY28_9BILA
MPSALEDANALFGFAHTTYDAGEDIINKPCTVLAYRMSDTVTEAMLRFAFGTLDIETRSISVHQSDVDNALAKIHDEYGADHGEIKFKILRFASRNIPPSKTVHLAGLPTTATKTEVVSWLASLGVHAASLAIGSLEMDSALYG